MQESLGLNIDDFLRVELDFLADNITYDPMVLLPKKSEDFIQKVLKDDRGDLVVNEPVHNMIHKFIRKARRKGYRKFLCAGMFGHGKCFLKGSRILTANYLIKKVEEVVVGDELMGDDGLPRKVLFLGNGIEESYKITLRNKDTFYCNESHILSLKVSREFWRHKKGEVLNIPLKFYLDLPEWIKVNCLKMYKVPLDFDEQDVPVAPYEYGTTVGGFRSKHGDYGTQFYRIWAHIKERCDNPDTKFYNNYGGRGIKYDPKWSDYLGFKEDMYNKYIICKKKYNIQNMSIERKDVNGHYCKDNCTFIERSDQSKNTRRSRMFKATSPDGDVYVTKNQNDFGFNFGLDQVRISRVLLGKEKSYRGWEFEYVEDRNDEVKDFDMEFDNISFSERIDHIYLKNSRENRLQLLAGILDTNGALFVNCYRLITKSSEFRDDYMMLCRSLGFNVTYHEEIYNEVPYYRVTISGETYLIPTRKHSVEKDIQNRTVLEYSFKVEPIGKQEYFGFGIDGNHLFLLHDFTVAHNTEQVQGFILHEIAKNPNILVKIIHISEKEATNRVRAISEYIRNDDDFKKLCPHVQPTGIWGQEKFIVKRRTVSKDATVSSYAAISGSLGGRAHLIFYDDINDLKSAVLEPSTRVNVQRMVTNVWDTRLIPENSEVIATLNRWHSDDIVAYFMSDPTWSWMSIEVAEDKNGLIYKDSFGKLTNLPLWSKYPKKTLEEKHVSMGDRDYNRAYRLMPYSDADKSFAAFESCCKFGLKASDIIGDLRDWIFAAGVDFAGPRREGTILTVGAINKFTGVKIPIELYALNKASDLSDRIVDTWQRFGIDLFLCENNAVQGAIIDLLQSALDKSKFRKYNIKIEGFNTGKNKSDPTQGLPSINKEMEKGEWLFAFPKRYTTTDNVTKDLWCRMYYEMINHPFNATDDFVMSIWFLRNAFQQIMIKDSLSMIY